ncbi:glycosyltransferase [Patescibacteria group bacterium]|nr:glycosyltransferase [Patescibacteria group bacterium]
MKTLTLVIPVYNEAKRLRKTFSTLNKWQVSAGLKLDQVIFVNDGSTDQSLNILKNTHLKLNKKIISYPKNMGKGFAIKKGMLASQADYTLMLDADMATTPSQIKKFLPLINKGTDVIVGTRKNGHSTVTIHQPFIRENLGKIFTKLSQIILGVQVTDFTCGFKAFSQIAKNDIFSKSLINRWGYDAEILFLAKKLNYSIAEKSVPWADQKGTKVNLIKDSISSLSELITIRLFHLQNKYQIKSPLPKFGYTLANA